MNSATSPTMWIVGIVLAGIIAVTLVMSKRKGEAKEQVQGRVGSDEDVA
jgi:hypothetical protein